MSASDSAWSKSFGRRQCHTVPCILEHHGRMIDFNIDAPHVGHLGSGNPFGSDLSSPSTGIPKICSPTSLQQKSPTTMPPPSGSPLAYVQESDTLPHPIDSDTVMAIATKPLTDVNHACTPTLPVKTCPIPIPNFVGSPIGDVPVQSSPSMSSTLILLTMMQPISPWIPMTCCCRTHLLHGIHDCTST